MYRKLLLAMFAMAAVLFVVLDSPRRDATQVVAASGPCDAEHESGPPIGPDEPLISGTVTSSSGPAIEDATIELYRCSGSTPIYVATDTTDENGDYAFVGLTPQRWYFVQAVMTGPLSGMSPYGGTQNPTALIGLGANATGVDFTFQ